MRRPLTHSHFSLLPGIKCPESVANDATEQPHSCCHSCARLSVLSPHYSHGHACGPGTTSDGMMGWQSERNALLIPLKQESGKNVPAFMPQQEEDDEEEDDAWTITSNRHQQHQHLVGREQKKREDDCETIHS